MTPKISIIVPIYNVEKYLDRCVNSLICQTLTEIEIILVDDSSPDNCPKMCDEYAKKDGRIKVIHKQNGGLGFARNSGMEKATGEYVAFVDSDDYVETDMFELMYNAAKSCDADFVRADNFRETADGKILNADYVSPLHEGQYDKQQLRDELLFPQLGMMPEESGDKYVSCSVWRNIYRKSIIDKYELKFVSERDLISEDIPFNLQFMMKCETAFVTNKKLYHYIVNDKSLTQGYKADRFDKEIILYNALCDMTKAADIYDNCAIRLKRHILDRTRRCIKYEFIGNPDKKAAKANVRKMTDDSTIKEIFKSYDLSKMPTKYKAVYIMIKHKFVNLLYLLRDKL